MKKKNYLPLIISLYINFIFQGMAAIILSQNMGIFEKQWSASVSQITLVISAIGLGRVLSLKLAGFISDVVGRKVTVLIGTVAYIIFFIGILMSDHYYFGFVMALFAGVGNAFLDTSTYPVVMEAFTSDNDSNALSVLNKSFISIGQFILPIVTRFLLSGNHYYGWTFVVSAVCLMINFILLFFLKFPERSSIVVEIHQLESEDDSLVKFEGIKSNMKKEGWALFAFSFVSVSLFNIFIMWVPMFAEQHTTVSSSDSLMFVSVYSIASFISVFVTSFIVKCGVSIPKLIQVCLLTAGLSIVYMLVSPSVFSITLASICIGVFAAGGIWQLGLSLLLEFFPYRKGTVTSNYSLATSFSVMVSPYFTGLLAERNLNLIFFYVILLVFLGSYCVSVVIRRHQEVFPNANHSLKMTFKKRKAI